jgi:hypothetical protein
MKIEVVPLQENYRPVLEYFPPVTANRMLPEWWKKLNLGNLKDSYLAHNDHRETGYNIKSCPAVQDILSEGFIIPMWSDFAFDTVEITSGDITEKKQHWYYALVDAVDEPMNRHVTFHAGQQVGDMPIGKTLHDNRVMKITLPYRFKVPEGYSIMYTDPFYHFRNDIKCLSGVVEADKWGEITFPFSIENDSFFIKAGTPLVHAFVYKRETENVTLDIQKGTQEDFDYHKKAVFHVSSSHIPYKQMPPQNDI